jgi:2'-hydroxyisoflavone reductase
MRVLILGGTQFLGRHIVETLLLAGHAVSVLNRGVSPDALPAQVERLRGDRDEGPPGLQALMGQTWDVCVDVSGYTPRRVRASAEALFANVKRYIFISAVSVYGDPQDRPVRETHPRLPPAGEHVIEVNGKTYGALKVACENVVQQVYGDRATCLRPQVIVGPHDPSGRYTYWVERAERGGEMLAPGDGSDHLQVIDARDLARFVATVIEYDLAGAFNLVGPRFTWARFITMLGPQNIVWVDVPTLLAAELSFNELPLFRPERAERSGLMDVSSARAQAAGLTLTEPEVTLRDVRESVRGGERAAAPSALSVQREAELIAVALRRTR